LGCGEERGISNQLRKNSEINRFLSSEKKVFDAEIKLLLLGSGESGKSTIAKQMKILHLDGFSPSETMAFKPVICSNIVSSMIALVEACQLTLHLNISRENADRAERIKDAELLDFSGGLTKEMASDIRALWKYEAIQSAFAQSNKFQLTDSAAYYFRAIDRIADKDYVPTVQDILRSRVKTTGIIETEFIVDKVKFRLMDVGGQKSERKKWMHCFEDVKSVIFCVALSEYDLKMDEDEVTSRMVDSLKLFKEICNSKWFSETSMILFLNKKDLFEEKIKRVDLKDYFPDYNGGKNYTAALQFIKEKFLAQNEHPRKDIYTHDTCATDTTQVMVVFNAVKDIILHEILDTTL